MYLTRNPLFLKSYSELEEFSVYIKNKCATFNIQVTLFNEFEKLIALMAIIALGEKKLSSMDEFYANDYFKLSLNIHHYDRFTLSEIMSNDNFKKVLSHFVDHVSSHLISSHLADKNEDIRYLLGFEGGEFDLELHPILLFIHQFLKTFKNDRQSKHDVFKKIKFTKTLESRFLKDGYLVIKNFLTTQEVDALKKITHQLAQVELDQHQAYLYGNGNKLQRVYNLLDKSEKFRELLCSSTVIDILETLFNRDTLHQKYYLSSFQANILNPGAEAQKLHVDSSVPDPLPPWLIRINVNFLLDDFTENNGSTMVAPGTHKNLRKPKANESVDLKKILAPAGSIVIWTGHLWHKSGANQSSQSRTALLACFAASYLREVAVEENYLEVMNQETIISCPKILQDMIGVGHGIKKGANFNDLHPLTFN